MTKRLYYTDPGLITFEATILEERTDAGRFLTRLDCSAFYPTSGGQLCDKGHIGVIDLVDVFEDSAGEVWHATLTSTGSPGTVVACTIDEERRWIHRQMHTAQHIVSQTAVRLFQAETVSVHLGEEYAAVELDGADLSSTQLQALEISSNRTLRANVPVEILFVSAEEVLSLSLRKMPERKGTIRIIKIGDYDLSACGGTHCSSTGQVGCIKILGVEKMRGHILVKFLSGAQALDDYSTRFRITDAISKAHSCAVTDIPAKVDKLFDEQKQLRKSLSATLREVVPVRAQLLIEKADRSGKYPTVVAMVEADDLEIAPLLAGELSRLLNGVAAVVCGDKCFLTAAPNTIDAGAQAKSLALALGLRGGGSPRAAQLGGMIGITQETLASFLREEARRA